jgi:hypothetical protein
MPDTQSKQNEIEVLTVDSIVEVPAPAGHAKGAEAYQLEEQRYKTEKLGLENRALALDTGHRDQWARKLLPLCLGWLISVVALLALQGFHLFGFHLDDSVLIAFIGTTTADVLGLGYIVVNYLFPKSS